MKFDQDKLAKHATLEEVEKEIFSPNEAKEVQDQAALRSHTRRCLAAQLSKAIENYMVQEDIGFNELQRRLGVSTATTSKILKGDGNVTLETIALISAVIGVVPELFFRKQA